MNVLRVLSDLEDEKFHGLLFVELNACNGGCVGGPLTVENPYVATAKTKRLHRYLPVSGTHMEACPDVDYLWEEYVEYEPVFRLGSNFRESFEMMGMVEDLTEQLPGLDCGSCGAPTCRALAEDIVRGEASRNDCIYEFIEYIQSLSGDLSYLTTEMEAAGHISPVDLQNLQHSIGKLALELRRKDV